jgi:hypothetical protein
MLGGNQQQKKGGTVMKRVLLVLAVSVAAFLSSACSSVAREASLGKVTNSVGTVRAKDPRVIASVVWSNSSYSLLTGGERVPVMLVVIRLANASDSGLRINLRSVELKVRDGQEVVPECGQFREGAGVYYLPAGQSRFVSLFFTIPEKEQPAIYHSVQLNSPSLQAAYCRDAHS